MKRIILFAVIAIFCFVAVEAHASIIWTMIDDPFNDLSRWGGMNLGSGYAEIAPAGQLHLDSTIVGDSNAGAVGQWIVGGIPDNFVINTRTFLDSIGNETGNAYQIQVDNGGITLFIQLRANGLYIIDKNDMYHEIGNDVVQIGQWQEWTFDVKGANETISNCDVYLNNLLLQSNVPCGKPGLPITDGFAYIGQYSYNTHTESHTDYFKLGEHVVPEPSSMMLLGLGLFGVGLFRRKKV